MKEIIKDNNYIYECFIIMIMNLFYLNKERIKSILKSFDIYKIN